MHFVVTRAICCIFEFPSDCCCIFFFVCLPSALQFLPYHFDCLYETLHTWIHFYHVKVNCYADIKQNMNICTMIVCVLVPCITAIACNRFIRGLFQLQQQQQQINHTKQITFVVHHLGIVNQSISFTAAFGLAIWPLHFVTMCVYPIFDYSVCIAYETEPKIISWTKSLYIRPKCQNWVWNSSAGIDSNSGWLWLSVWPFRLDKGGEK